MAALLSTVSSFLGHVILAEVTLIFRDASIGRHAIQRIREPESIFSFTMYSLALELLTVTCSSIKEIH